MGKKASSGSSCSLFNFFLWVTILLWAALIYFFLVGGGLKNASDAIQSGSGAVLDTSGGNDASSNLLRVRGAQPPAPAAPAVAPRKARATSFGNDTEVHVIFSTDCGTFQDWQTLLLFHSAKVAGQQGPITRIASGCDDAKKEVLTALYKKLHPEYHVHFTPDFKIDKKTGKKYDFYNKPYGVKHWLENADPPVDRYTVIALIDPDMIFVRPITASIAGSISNIVSGGIKESSIIDFVSEGHPVAQQYGLGAPWVNDNHKKFHRINICGADSPCMKVPNEDYGWKHFSVGPPYIMARDDMIRIVNTWTEFVPRVYVDYPFLLAEMYAYSMAAAHEELPHLRLDNYMVSDVTSAGEGWKWVDSLDDACEAPVNGIFYPGRPMPSVVHVCQKYHYNGLDFAKRRIDRDIFSCDKPMLLEPPAGYGVLSKKFDLSDPNAKKAMKFSQRDAFVICVVYRAMNSALEDYKNRMCEPGTANYAKTQNAMSPN